MAAKVSKNIKALRNEQGITQDALAEQIGVTRQAISNWENDKSQPDIETLKLLSELFQVEIEELIYGKKRNIGTQIDTKKQSLVVRILLSIIGSLFIGIGMVLIFVNFWSEFPFVVKTILSILPILLGQSFAIYVFKHKKASVLWSESAAIFWGTGIVATIALINSVFNIHMGFANSILIDIILCLPIIYIFNSVAGLTAYFGMLIGLATQSVNFTNVPILQSSLQFVVLIALFLLGGAYLFYIKEKSETAHYKYSLWITIVAMISIVIILTTNSGLFDYIYLYYALFAVFFALYSYSGKGHNYSLPFQTIGIPGMMAMLCGLVNINSYRKMLLNELVFNLKELKITDYIFFSIFILAVAAGIFLGRESLKQNPLKIMILSFAGAGLLCIPWCEFNVFFWVIFAISVTIGILFIICGVQELSLFKTNIGLIAEFVLISFLLSLVQKGFLLIGIVFLVFGSILIFINTKLTKTKKQMKSLQNSEEEI